jgi:DNA-binding transcriptional LysR family regulator
LSHTLRGLEARLGIRLLTRTTRSVSTTRAGDHLLQTVGQRFEEIETELERLSELRDKPAGTIRITATEYATDSVLLPKLAKVLPHYPDVSVEITIDYGLTDIVAQGCGRTVGRAGGEGHDRGAHRTGHAYGRCRRTVVFRDAPTAEEAAGSHRPQLHQLAPANARRHVRMGVRERQT